MIEIPLLIIIPLLAVFLIVALARDKGKRAAAISLIAVFILCYVFKNIFIAVGQKGIVFYKLGGWAMPEGINLIVDGLGVFMFCVVYFFSMLGLIYSIGYMKILTDIWKYYVLFLILILGVSGVVLAGDIFTLYVFLEICAVASYSLLSINLKRKALFGAFGYMRMGMISSLLILLGIAISYNYLSTLSIADFSQQLGLRNQSSNIVLNNNIVMMFVSFLFLGGFALKAGLVPFHFWVVDAHANAPAPVTMILSSVIMPILGIYPIIRIFFNMIGITPRILSLMMIMGIISMILGVLLSLRESNFKKIIAHNCISELGFVIFGIGIGSALGLAGAMLHIISHAFSSSILSASAGVMDFEKKGNNQKASNIIKWATLIGAGSAVGIAPFNGFWSKMLIIMAAWSAGYKGNCLIVGAVIIFNALNLFKARDICNLAKSKQKNAVCFEKSPFAMRFCLLILIAFSVSVGILWFSGARQAFIEPAVKTISQESYYNKMEFR